MAVNELNLAINKKNFGIDNRLLGTFGIIGAPMLLAQFLSGQNTTENKFIAFLGVIYIFGWMANLIGMRRQNVLGNNFTGKIIFGLQFLLLCFAFISSALETAGRNFENGGAFFAICDAGYPLSHLFMIVTGAFALKARVWRGISAFAPLVVGLALPVFFAFSFVISSEIGAICFAALTAAGLGVIGFRLFQNPTAQDLINN